MAMVTSFGRSVSCFPPIALLTSTFRDKQPVIPGLVSTRANDPYRYWKLWHHPEDMDSIIACIMWGETHRFRAMDIAPALTFVQPADYWGMNAEDVINVYDYLKKYQDIPKNPFAHWQSMRDMRWHPHSR